MNRMQATRSPAFLLLALLPLLAAGCEDEENGRNPCKDLGGWGLPFGCAGSSSIFSIFQRADPYAPASAECRVPLDGDRVLVAGDPTGLSADCRIEDTVTGLEFPIAPLQSPRAFASGIQLEDGRVLVTGGLDPEGRIRSDAELYDPEADTWTPLDSVMRTGRAGHVLEFVAEGIVEIRGGAPEEAGLDYFLADEMAFADDPGSQRDTP